MPKTLKTAKGSGRNKTQGGTERSRLVAARVLKQISEQIVSRFPEMKSIRPSVVRRKVPSDLSIVDMIERVDGELGATLAGMKSRARKKEIYCASFQRKIKTSSGTVLRKIVRVTFDKDGHILKLVASK